MFPVAAHSVSGTEVTLSLSISWTDCFCWLEMIQKVKGDRNKNRSGSWKVFRCSPGRLDMRWRNPATVFQPLQSLLIHLKVFLFSSCRPFAHEGLTPFANTFTDVLSKKHCLLETVIETVHSALLQCYNPHRTLKSLGELANSRMKTRVRLAHPPGKIRFHGRSLSNGNTLTKHSSDPTELLTKLVFVLWNELSGFFLKEMKWLDQPCGLWEPGWLQNPWGPCQVTSIFSQCVLRASYTSSITKPSRERLSGPTARRGSRLQGAWRRYYSNQGNKEMKVPYRKSWMECVRKWSMVLSIF